MSSSTSSLAFKVVSLPSSQLSSEAELLIEIKEKLSQDASCRASDIQLTVDSFSQTELYGRAQFQTLLCCERALVSLQQNGQMIHYTEEDAIDCSVEVVEDHNEDPYFFQESTIEVQPLRSYIDSISLFNTFRSYGPISKVKIDLEATPTGNLVRVGTLAFSHPSSSSAAINSVRTNPHASDPCTLQITSDASEPGSRPWKDYEDEQELEETIRESFPEAVEVRVVGFLSVEEEVVGLARYSSLEEVKQEWLGKVTLGSLGAVLVEQLSLTDGCVPLQATSLFSAPSSRDPRLAKPPPRRVQPPYHPPSSESQRPQPSKSPSKTPSNPVASGSSQLSNNPALLPQPQSQPHSFSQPPSSSTSLQRPPWKSSLKPYEFNLAPTRPRRADEPLINESYAVCELPPGDAERRRDVVLSYHGQEWPDFSTMDIRKRDDISSLASREIRHKEEQSALTKRSVQIKSEELRVLESSWATSDLPEPGQELSDSERRAMEASLVDLELGLQRRQRHDDALLHFIRTREDPKSMFATSPQLLTFGGLGISKRTKASDPRVK
ncbi:hypothetical protein BDY24DRAFT_402576 [Mrakia frigida]|uniref:uncharacterized protein n=1 Tax=Mrakia frigida TaxID=29902 RepID=UPI003FCBF752